MSRAVAEAYASGAPLRLVLYEADWAYHSGKYFHSSDACDWNTEGCPALTITWGRAVADLEKAAIPSFGDQGNSITYALSFFGSGNTQTLTDTLPVGTSAPGNFELEGTSVTPTYEGGQHRLTWSDTLSVSQEVTIHYPVTITTSDRQALINIAELCEEGGEPGTATATVIANPHLTHLPLTLKNN